MSLLWWITLAVFVTFNAFTLFVMFRENFFQSCKIVFARLWGRQVVADLYIGIFLFHFFVYVREGSLLITLAWLIPTLIFGNPVTLLYMLVRVL